MPSPPPLTEVLGYLLGQAHLQHRQVAEAEMASLDLKGKEFGALAVLVREGGMSQRELGARMGVDRTTMVAVADELERKGYIERTRNPSDRRAYALVPTASGRRTLKRAVTATARAEARFLAQLSAAEQRELKRLLRRLLET